ncbi:MAG: pyridine nucleotide-disulfide oxidoreductase [Acidimicrobiales bacterium]|nr:FAD-dependent oxidoreductase [Hyphomonadaceae bacterium]RZV44562.1 MAG: pyridine nucleotide-disulfide oxidoreductase [Acidimicrobiales bacterium]
MKSTPEKTCIVVGASHAAAQFVVSLRQGGWDGRIIMIGDEMELPYHRPPLSKDFLSGDKSHDDILLRPASVYEKAEVELKLGVRVEAIDRDSRTVTTDSGEVIAYSKLVLATGARVRQLPVPGADLDNVFYLRDATDVRAIKVSVAPGKSAVIIGGGYIGLETAASLRKQGMDVTVLEAMPRILQRVTAPDLSMFYKRVHTEEGVEILESVAASEIQETDSGLKVLTGGDTNLDADMVIIGIGVIPNSELAEQAGLQVSNGIEVDEFACTDDPDIYAIGDVTWHYNPIYDRHIRLESVPNATEQAKTAALAINGNPKPYNSLPWFWSDQFDLKLQIAGLSQGHDSVVIRGDITGSRSFAAFYFEGDRLLAVDAVNRPREFMMTRQVLTRGQTLDKAIINNDGADLKSAIV